MKNLENMGRQLAMIDSCTETIMEEFSSPETRLTIASAIFNRLLIDRFGLDEEYNDFDYKQAGRYMLMSFWPAFKNLVKVTDPKAQLSLTLCGADHPTDAFDAVFKKGKKQENDLEEELGACICKDCAEKLCGKKCSAKCKKTGKTTIVNTSGSDMTEEQKEKLNGLLANLADELREILEDDDDECGED